MYNCNMLQNEAKSVLKLVKQKCKSVFNVEDWVSCTSTTGTFLRYFRPVTLFQFKTNKYTGDLCVQRQKIEFIFSLL